MASIFIQVAVIHSFRHIYCAISMEFNVCTAESHVLFEKARTASVISLLEPNQYQPRFHFCLGGKISFIGGRGGGGGGGDLLQDHY